MTPRHTDHFNQKLWMDTLAHIPQPTLNDLRYWRPMHHTTNNAMLTTTCQHDIDTMVWPRSHLSTGLPRDQPPSDKVGFFLTRPTSGPVSTRYHGSLRLGFCCSPSAYTPAAISLILGLAPVQTRTGDGGHLLLLQIVAQPRKRSRKATRWETARIEEPISLGRPTA